MGWPDQDLFSKNIRTIRDHVRKTFANFSNNHDKETDLRAIIDGSLQGILIHRDKKPLFANQAFAKIMGYKSPEEILQIQSIVSLIAPHEHDELLIDQKARKENHSIPDYYIFDAHRKDGSIIILQQFLTTIIWGGKPAILCTISDITERRKIDNIQEARLRIVEFAEKNPLDALMQYAMDEMCTLTNSPIGFFHYVEPDQQKLTLQAWSTFTLERMCTAEGKGHHYDIDEAGVWVDCVREGRPIIHNDYANLSHRKGLPDGHTPVIREMVIPLIRDENIVAILGVGNKEQNYNEADVTYALQLADLIWDITERKRAEQALKQMNRELTERIGEIEGLQAILREQAIRDALTGLFNRRYLHETLEREIARANRRGDEVSLMLLDIDHFKRINDTYGHAAGDEILRSLSIIISVNIRREDIPCRYGGEEFVIVMPNAPLHIAEKRADTLHKKINALQVDFDGQKLGITVSLGIAAFPQHGITGDEVLRCADRALYEAKQAGRNCIIVHENKSNDSENQRG